MTAELYELKFFKTPIASHASSALRQPSGAKGLRFSEISNLSDIDDIIYLAKRAHDESRFSYIEFAPEKVKSIVKRALEKPKQNGIFLAHRGDKAVGFVYFSIGEYHIGKGTYLTTIHNINVLKEERSTLNGGRIALGLLRGVETWSQARSSSEILFHVTSGVELARTHKLIKRVGYRLIGGSYAKNFIQ